jgi:ribosomal protein L17
MSWSKDTGPEVSQGVDGDLAAVYQGGENFLARAQMLSNMRAEADKAVKALKEGRDIDWTLDRALEARKEADRLAAKAKETLEAAVKQHDASVRDSNAEAHSLIQRATADAAVIAAGAEQAKADAARYVDQQRAKAEEIIRGAEARMAEPSCCSRRPHETWAASRKSKTQLERRSISTRRCRQSFRRVSPN